MDNMGHGMYLYSLLLGTHECSPFTTIPILQRLRQGHPISPYLFILYAKCLDKLIQKRNAKNTIAGIIMGPNRDLSHLQSLDETVMWGEATSIRNLLDSYIANKGQLLNENKSEVVFFNVTKRVRERITQILRF